MPAAGRPQPGDFDADLERWEVVARGPALEGGRPFVLDLSVPLDLEDLRALMEAAAAEGLDAREYVQRAVGRLAEALRDGHATFSLAEDARAASE